jgi:hypothetical protein
MAKFIKSLATATVWTEPVAARISRRLLAQQVVISNLANPRAERWAQLIAEMAKFISNSAIATV